MNEKAPHPSREQLCAYNLGKLSPQEAIEVENHISRCSPCCETIIGLAADDTFVAALQEARDLPKRSESQARKAHPGASEVPGDLAEHDRYEIVELAGRGGMGAVFQARHRKMDRTVALKVINSDLIQKRTVVERFQREVKAAAKLSHPNIVTAFDADSAGDSHFMVMEYVSGTDLFQTVRTQGALPYKQACEYVRQVALGLQHAHEQGMVHRDIKPHNLMVTEDGTVKILDFGLASLTTESGQDASASTSSSDLTSVGTIMGTPDFISPEQAQDASSADIRSDIYSLGASLYFLLSGRPPFEDGSVMQKIQMHAQQEPESLDTLREDLPIELCSLVSKMMAKDPDNRFPTPESVAESLEPFVDGENSISPQAENSTTAVPQLASDSKRIRVAAIPAALMLVGIFALVGFALNGFGPSDLAEENSQQAAPDPVTLTPSSVFNAQPFQFGSKIQSLEYSPDGKQLLSAGGAWGAVLWDAQTGGLIHHFSKMQICIGATASFSPDGRLIGLAGTQPGPAMIWNAETGSLVQTFDYGTVALRFSPDGQLAFTKGDHGIEGYDVKTGNAKAHISSSFRVDGMATSTNGSLIAALTSRGQLDVWDIQAGFHATAEVGPHGSADNSLTFMPSGDALLVRSASGVELRDARSLEVVRKFPCEHGKSLAVSRDGSRLAIGGSLGIVSVFEVETGDLIKSWQAHSNDIVSAVALTPDGKQLACGTQIGSQVRIWEVDSQKELFRTEMEQISLAQAMSKVSGDDRKLNEVNLTKQLRELAEKERGGVAIESLVVSANGSRGAVALRNSRVLVYDVEKSALVQEFVKPRTELGGGKHYAALSSDGALLATGGKKKLQLIHLLTRESLPVPLLGEWVSGLKFSSSNTLAIHCGNRVLLWDPQNKKMIQDFVDEKNGMQTMALSPDGKVLATSSHDFADIVTLWNTEDGTKSFDLHGAWGGANELAFTSDGQQVYAKTSSSIIVGWDLSK